jgi:hypothetical protein
MPESNCDIRMLWFWFLVLISNCTEKQFCSQEFKFMTKMKLKYLINEVDEIEQILLKSLILSN